MTKNDFTQLMAAIGPLDERVQAVMQGADGGYSVLFEDWAVGAEFEEASNRVFLSVELGVPPADRAAEINEFLLVYAGSYATTGGLSFALSGPGGSLFMLVTLSAAALDARTLVIIVTNLVSRAATLKALIEAGGTAAVEATADAAPVFGEPMIRI